MEYEDHGNACSSQYTGSMSKTLQKLNELRNQGKVEIVQTAELLGSARILRKVLDIYFYSISNNTPQISSASIQRYKI